jgi:hypothetical protein
VPLKIFKLCTQTLSNNIVDQFKAIKQKSTFFIATEI